MTPQEFAHKWRHNQLKERSFYQEHFLDVCRLVGHPTPGETDRKGNTFTFEAATPGRVGAGRGFADVWKKGFFAWEYKGKYADFDKAYEQLLRYREALENPYLLVVADADLIRIHTNFSNSIKRVYELTLDDLLDPAKLALLRAVFYEPLQLKAPETPAQVTEQAAREFAKLARILRDWGEKATPTAHFLIRLLFCLFAEDVGLLPKDLFTRLVSQARHKTSMFTSQLRQLFAAMSTGGSFGEHEIPHIDGGLFDDAIALDLASDGIDVLNGLTGLDWGGIEPSILGTLFERSLDPSKRAQLGAHYTSREDILLIVEPVLMAPLRRKWNQVEAEARGLAVRMQEATSSATRTRLSNDLSGLLHNFADELTTVRVLDPACGSGNFLYVALRQLLDLWKEVSNLAGELGLPLMMATSAPSPTQLFGIEVNEYAHELAQATIWIGYIQWLRENGYGLPPEPVLRQLGNIRRMDAILAFDEGGKPVEPAWPEAEVVVGNPPFLGGNKIRAELRDAYVNALFKLYEGRVPAFADLVCYWFERARGYIEQGQVKRAGLLATNSIRGGVNRRVLERIKESGDIFMAWSDRDWVLDGAAVRVSMVGFDSGDETNKTLNGSDATIINPDLTSIVNLSQAKPLFENKDICVYGSQQKGSFDISPELARKFIEEINPFGRNNRDVIKPAINATQLLRRTEESWVIDFGVDMPIEEASLYEGPFEYVRKIVYPERKDRNETRQRDYWWLHARPSPRYRKILREQKRYIASPALAKHRIFVWLDNKVLADHALLVYAREDDYFFGVLQSKIHELWALSLGTSLEDRPRYTPSSTFETFPFPWPPGQEPQDDPRVQAIADAARELNEKRERWLHPDLTPGPSPSKAMERGEKARTLTNLYNQRPTWLALAHEKLDRAVLDAYGWQHDLGDGRPTDEEILGRLLEENLRRGG